MLYIEVKQRNSNLYMYSVLILSASSIRIKQGRSYVYILAIYKVVVQMMNV